MSDPIYDSDLLWLREGYLSEMPIVEWITDPGELALEMDASRGNGLYAKWRDRLGSDSYMDQYRRVLLPFHEAVKRLGPVPERRWLRYALSWRGLPCLCAHATVCSHLAMVDRTREEQIVGGIRIGVRRVLVKLDQLFDISRRARIVVAGRQSVPSRVFTPTDTAPVQRTAGPVEQTEDLGVTTRGIESETPGQKKFSGYVCRASGQWVVSCDCPPFDVDDSREAA